MIKSKTRGNIIDFTALIISFITTFCFFKTLIWDLGGYKLQLCYLSIFITATIYIVCKNGHFNKMAILPGTLAILMSFAFSIHEENFFQIIGLLVLLSGIYCMTLTKSNHHSSSSWQYLIDLFLSEFIIPIINIFNSIISSVNIANNDNKANKKNIKWIIAGVVLALPLIIIIFYLLESSDIAFSSASKSILNILDNFFKMFEEIDFFEIIIEIIFWPYIFSVMFCFANGVNYEQNKFKTKSLEKLQKAPDNFITAFLSAISLIYILYLITQFSYLFSAFTGHLPNGSHINVIQYARSGFFGLLAIAGINFTLVFFITIFAQRKNGKISKTHRIFSVFLSVYTLFITSTSIAKILMYINIYGVTNKRLLALIADIILIICFISIIIKLYKSHFQYAKIMIGSFFILMSLYNIVGPANIIIVYNTNAYLSGKIKTIDYEEFNLYNIPLIEKIKEVADTGNYQASECYENSLVDYIDTYVYSLVDTDEFEHNLSINNENDINNLIEHMYNYIEKEYKCQNLSQYINKSYILNNKDTLKNDFIEVYKSQYYTE